MDQITPIILTYNEAPNVRGTLEQLRWAQDIIVVDSFSDDETLATLAEFPQVRVFQRPFDSFDNQCNYALKEIRLVSEWVLALDADYVLTPEVVEEMRGLRPAAGINGFRAHFVYCVHGRPLRGSAYPPVTVLYRHRHAHYLQDGHAHRVVVEGEIQNLRFPILHDDRKSLTRWLWSQDMYIQQELSKLRGAASSLLGWPDHLRKTRWLFPFVMFFYCLFVRGGILDGWAGIHYAFQRMLAEILLALYLIDEDLREPEVGGQRSRITKGQRTENMEQGAASLGVEFESGDQRSEARAGKGVRHKPSAIPR